MSIASELSALAANKAAIKAAIEAKNPATPPTDALAQWPDAIASIPEGGGGGGGNIVCVSGNVQAGSGNFQDYISLRADGVEIGYGDSKLNVDTVSIDGVNDYNHMRYILSDGTTGSSNGTIQLNGRSLFVIDWYVPCLISGTRIITADGVEKEIDDITYDDVLAVWDFDRGEISSARPLWICRGGKTDFMYRCRFASGRELLVTGPRGHRGFSVDKGTFAYLPECVNDRIATKEGCDVLIGCTKENGDFRYYNIITEGHFNLYANRVLTSCRLNNYRKFSGRDLRFAERPTTYHPASDFDGIPEAYVSGLHLCEQPAGSAALRSYVARLLATEVHDVPIL